MTVFGPVTNRISGYTVRVYSHGPHQYEVEITDFQGDYVGGHTAESQGEAIRYALDHI